MYTITLKQTAKGWEVRCEGVHTHFRAEGETEAEALEGLVLLFQARPKKRIRRTPQKAS
jgi:hypothetical protein